MSIISQTIIYITYLGTASFLIDTGDIRLLTDPGDFFTWRFSEEKAKALKDIDIILITHADFDHVNRLELIPNLDKAKIIGTKSVQARFPSLQVYTGDIYEKEGNHAARLPAISIRRIDSIHGARHDVDHSSYLITTGSITILFLGDAYKLSEGLIEKPDIMLVTICGIEASPENGVRLARAIKPEAVIPMHWEVLFRTDEPALRLSRLLAEAGLDSRCFIPGFDRRFTVKKGINLEIAE